MFATRPQKPVECFCPVVWSRETFRVEFPQSETMSVLSGPADCSCFIPRVSGARRNMPDEGIRSCILIVDDEREITEILSDLLCAEHDCQTAGSAEEALVRLR